MPNEPVPAAATGLPAAPNFGETPSRRLFLAAGPAAAVFGALSAKSALASQPDPVFAALGAARAARTEV